MAPPLSCQTVQWTCFYVTCHAAPQVITLAQAILTSAMTRTSLGTILYLVISNKTTKGVVVVTMKIDQHLQKESNNHLSPQRIPHSLFSWGTLSWYKRSIEPKVKEGHSLLSKNSLSLFVCFNFFTIYKHIYKISMCKARPMEANKVYAKDYLYLKDTQDLIQEKMQPLADKMIIT